MRLKLEKILYLFFVEEEPLIQNVIFNGLKASKFIDPLKKTIKLRDRSSFKYSFEDKKNIEKL